jgi:hypothetical protein
MLFLCTCKWIPVLDNAGAVVTPYRNIFCQKNAEQVTITQEKKHKMHFVVRPQNF